MPRSNNLISHLIDLIFPPICFACSARIEDREPFLCLSCRKELKEGNDVCCPTCGAFDTLSRENCHYCNAEKAYFDKCRSLFPYNNVVRSLIHELKYREMTKIAPYLADHTIKYLHAKNPFPKVDFVCPVPLHPTKKRDRGYNQAAIIARNIAEHFAWEYKPDLIKRTKYTESQSRLSTPRRKDNVSRAFSIDRNSILYEVNILIIDDVFTTGATVNSICRILKEYRVDNIYVFTVARA